LAPGDRIPAIDWISLASLRDSENGLRIPRLFGHPFHEHPATDSTLIRPPVPHASGH
jgi:hypothetical protein